MFAVLAFGVRLLAEIADLSRHDSRPQWTLISVGALAVLLTGFLVLTRRFAAPPATFRVTGLAFVAQQGRMAGVGVIVIGWAVGGLTFSLVVPSLMLIAGGAIQFWPRVKLTPRHLIVRNLISRRILWERIPPDGVHQYKLTGVEVDVYSSMGHWRTVVMRPVTSHVSEEFLVATIEHYAKHPEHRAAIGTQAELSRLQAALLRREPAETKWPDWMPD